ncbi:MAG: class I SAM-dependent methyltransferase [Armatimonadetes bacterium]|nr:class I SAM-dependent methyltransferase [Armatimonadota bacterium]
MFGQWKKKALEDLAEMFANRADKEAEAQCLRLSEITRRIGDDWKQAVYFDEAEADMESQWNTTIWPMIRDCEFTTTLDLAAGHGRNSEKLKQVAQKVIIADINAENVEYCRQRFADDPRFEFVLTNGLAACRSLPTHRLAGAATRLHHRFRTPLSAVSQKFPDSVAGAGRLPQGIP